MIIANLILVIQFFLLGAFTLLLVIVSVKIKQHLTDPSKINFQTGLPNRNFILEKLNNILKNTKKNNTRLAFIYLDIDNFKDVNDTLGYAVGDLLLKEIAGRITYAIEQEENLIAHLDSDEFCILLENAPLGSKELSAIANNLLNLIAAVYYIKGHNISITASIGIATYPDSAKSVEELVSQAEIAKHEVKKSGKNGYNFFTAEMSKRSLENAELILELKKALQRNDQLYLCYQPQVATETGKITGAEALIRWQHPIRGNIPPDVFIPLAEASGSIMEVGDFIIKRACQDLKILKNIGLDKVQVAINLSAQQFSKGDVAGIIAEAVWNSGIDPKYLELELTESLLMKNPEKSLLMLRVLKSMGIRLAIDDFGTGYSSLSYLKKFPINSLKIASYFVQGIEKDKDNQVIVATIMDMATNLGLNIVVEGVETKEELNQILTTNSNLKIQGYYFSQPLNFAAYKSLLLENNREPFTIRV